MTMWNRLSNTTIKRVAVALERKICFNSETLIMRDQIPEKLFMLKEGCLCEVSLVNCKDESYKFGEYNQSFIATNRFRWVLLD